MSWQARASADGWRGVIGTDFTPATAAVLASRVVKAVDSKRVLVGYDCREGGADAAQAVVSAAVAAGAAEVRLVAHLPTPTATAAVRLGLVDLALLITASHNPAHFNGLKVKVAPGGPLPRAVEAAIETADPGPVTAAPDPVPAEPLAPWLDAHMADVLSRLSARSELSVVVDGLGGIAGAPFAEFAGRLGWRALSVDGGPAPDFGRLVPDPTIPAARQRARDRVVAERADLGVVLDGDGDRVYLLDHRGATVYPHELLALLLAHREPGVGLGVTAASGTAARAVAARLGIPVHEVGIGFKHLSPLLAAGEVDAAGGGVGDLGFAEFGTDRDPFAVAVLLADLLATSGRPLAALVDDLRAEVGPLTWFEYLVAGRSAVDLTELGHRALAVAGQAGAVTGVTTVDGVKFWLDGGQWLLLRASTTEGGIRVYGETRDQGVPAVLVDAIRR
ncbi:hypothetical protein [Actinokineospora sp. NBRC 105648]|uniref:hypothetical protein n=1 Tax=Actinokineospora sp. NBRC 105648 TaxID=3032206 RepID=UPI00249FCF54|nr:hypothetical protein [Actinokineospora sp. NBRC 105648]GLZ37109.1 phosphomannomutase [Actinokineospora sp. NBRC 105648]